MKMTPTPQQFPINVPMNVLIADDDIDDCFFFKTILEELPLSTSLIAVHNGEQLMQFLENKSSELPHVLFLDLNMPRKNGFECLTEIKENERLKDLPIVIFSTSYEQSVVNRLYQSGAQYFVRKPSGISQFENIVLQTLLLIKDGNVSQPTRENFVLSVQSR